MHQISFLVHYKLRFLIIRRYITKTLCIKQHTRQNPAKVHFLSAINFSVADLSMCFTFIKRMGFDYAHFIYY